MNYKQILIFGLLSLIIFSSCKKNEVKKAPDVYIGGSSNGMYAYWKNGEIHLLGEDENMKSMCVGANNDVFIANRDGYLKNGDQVHLPDAGFNRSIFINGDDVYAVGTCVTPYYAICYWKNGSINLLTADTLRTDPGQMFISTAGKDLYIAAQYGRQIIYWKNGLLSTLDSNTFISDMTTNGSDFYITGYTITNSIYEGVYWKNGVKHQLYANDEVTKARVLNSIHIYKKDVYITGTANGSNGRPLYWKNDIPVGNTDNNIGANSIAAIDGDVYITGNIVDNSGIVIAAVLWKNGIMDTLKDCNGVSKVLIGN